MRSDEPVGGSDGCCAGARIDDVTQVSVGDFGDKQTVRVEQVLVKESCGVPFQIDPGVDSSFCFL